MDGWMDSYILYCGISAKKWFSSVMYFLFRVCCTFSCAAWIPARTPFRDFCIDLITIHVYFDSSHVSVPVLSLVYCPSVSLLFSPTSFTFWLICLLKSVCYFFSLWSLIMQVQALFSCFQVPCLQVFILHSMQTTH